LNKALVLYHFADNKKKFAILGQKGLY